MLRLELGELKELGFDLAPTGFNDIELAALFAEKTQGLTDPDDATSREIWCEGRLATPLRSLACVDRDGGPCPKADPRAHRRRARRCRMEINN